MDRCVYGGQKGVHTDVEVRINRCAGIHLGGIGSPGHAAAVCLDQGTCLQTYGTLEPDAAQQKKAPSSCLPLWNVMRKGPSCASGTLGNCVPSVGSGALAKFSQLPGVLQPTNSSCHPLDAWLWPERYMVRQRSSTERSSGEKVKLGASMVSQLGLAKSTGNRSVFTPATERARPVEFESIRMW